MRKVAFLFSIIFISIYTISSQGVNPVIITPIKDIALKQKFTFYKKDNPNKIFRIKSGKSITIISSDSILPLPFQNFRHAHFFPYIYARLYSKNDSMLFVYSVGASTNSSQKALGGTFYKNEHLSYPSDSIIGIKLKDIKCIQYYKPQTLAKAIMICFPLSIISGLIVAPATSIDLPKGTINSQLYSDILYPSIGVFGLGFFTFMYEFSNNKSTVILQVTK